MLHLTDVRATRPMVGSVVGAGGALLALWAVFVRHSPDDLDQDIYRDLHGTAGSGTARFAAHLTDIGDGAPLVAVLCVLGVLAFTALRSWRPLLTSGGAVALGAVISTVVKLLADRARPPAAGWLVADASGNSFPSGHTTVTTAGYLGLAVGVAALLRRSWARNFVVAAGAALAVTIGWTRIELGVHWPTDVVAGWTVGLLAVVVANAVVRELPAPAAK
jgi:membrane-associated phospholipid phosphatase